MPTPSEPISQQLVAAVIARLAAITTGATYWLAPDVVLTESINFPDMTSTGKLIYSVISGNEAPVSEDNRDVHEGLLIHIKVWCKANEGDDRMRMLRRAIRDIKVAIATDERWSGLAVWTSAPSVEVDDPSEIKKPFSHCKLTMTIHYDRQRTAA